MPKSSSSVDGNYIQANINGKLCDAKAPCVSPLDRGFLYGDAIYEVWRTYGGVVFAWDEHWERLLNTANGLGMDLQLNQDDALDMIRFTAKEWREKTGSDSELYIRLQVSRGAGLVGLDIALADEENVVFLVKAQPEMTASVLEKGVRLHVSDRWKRNSSEALPPALKTGNYLNNILGLSDAKKKGFDDVLFLNHSGNITEASTRNVWFVFDDRIVTPSLKGGLLAGVTRRILLEQICEIDGRPLVEERLTVEDALFAHECFLTSTTHDIQPVAAIDGFDYNVGGQTVTRDMKKRFATFSNFVVEHTRSDLWV